MTTTNIFWYKDSCPTCAAEGLLNPDSGEESKLGFDMDNKAILCKNGHTFETMTGEKTVAKRDDEQATETVEKPQAPEVVSPQVENENLYTLEQGGSDLTATSPEADSNQLAEISAQLTAPEPEVMPIVAPARRDPVVADGVTLSNGDLVVAVTVPEQWAQAVVAEAEAQGKSIADYLSGEVADYLADYWTASYTQSK